MAQTCSPCSVPLCGKTVTKTRQELNAEVMVITTSTIIVIIQFNSILYFNVLTQQLQEPITESAQEDKYIHTKENNNNNNNNNNIKFS
jgi:hypothetical protein